VLFQPLRFVLMIFALYKFVCMYACMYLFIIIFGTFSFYITLRVRINRVWIRAEPKNVPEGTDVLGK